MGTQLKGDFIGFSFDGNHSSDLGIVRTSNGSRYDDNLLPTSQDKTAAVPGGDGTYYWDTSHTQKPFNVPIAFDSLTEEQYRRLKQVFNTKNLGKLIFDEAPYKYYMAKPTGIPQLKTICFDQNGQRIYKGEGTIQFIAYYPYAKSVHKYFNEYLEVDYPNKEEWKEAANLLESQGDYDQEGSTINLYNPGDFETDFTLDFKFPTGTYVPCNSNEGISDTKNYYQLKQDSNSEYELVISPTFNDLKAGEYYEYVSSPIKTFSLWVDNDYKLELNDITNIGDYGIRINTKTNLINGIDENGNITKSLYNKHIKSGIFFKIPITEFRENPEGEMEPIDIVLTISGATPIKIDYQYIYY